MNSPKTFETMLEGSAFGTFSPFAYYDKFMDTIRVELRDCSTYEVRLDETFTLIMDLYPEENKTQCAGLVIKGIGHLFKGFGLPMSGVVEIVHIINKILEQNGVFKDKILPIREVAAHVGMKVEMAKAA